jgi:BlaI family transcriptional regulator, penicillinase repressor
MPSVRPSALELQILSVLWDQGPSTVHAIRESLADGKERAYTTVLTTVQIMEKKGFVGHTVQGNAHLYQPQLKRHQVLRPLMRDFLQRAFGGDPAEAVQCLLDSKRLSEDELSQIRRILKDAEDKRRGQKE